MIRVKAHGMVYEMMLIPEHESSRGANEDNVMAAVGESSAKVSPETLNSSGHLTELNHSESQLGVPPRVGLYTQNRGNPLQNFRNEEPERRSSARKNRQGRQIELEAASKMLPTAANLTLLQENHALASQHQVIHNANQPFIMKKEAKQQDDMEAMQAKVNGLCSIMQTVVETVEQLSSLSSSGSGGGSAKIERNESSERKERDAEN